MKKRDLHDDSDEFDVDEPEEIEESGLDWDPEDEDSNTKKRKSSGGGGAGGDKAGCKKTTNKKRKTDTEPSDEDSGVRINLNWSSDFVELKKQTYYQDKTDFIGRIFNVGKYEGHGIPSKALIVGPRRFFKSSALDMLKRFCKIQVSNEDGSILGNEQTDSYELFKDTKIWKCEDAKQHFNRYPVISLNFQKVNVSTLDDFCLSVLTIVVKDAFFEHQYLLNSRHLLEKEKQIFKKYMNYDDQKSTFRQDVISNPIKTLATYLQLHFSRELKCNELKVLLLIDEINFPVISAVRSAVSNDLITEINTLMNNMIIGLSKTNLYIGRCVFMSSLYVGGYLSPVNMDLENIHFRDEVYQLAKYFTFTEQEVKSLLEKFCANSKLEEVRSYFGGYGIRDVDPLYNPFSVLRYCQKKRLKLYWANGGAIELLRKGFLNEQIMGKVSELIKGNKIEVNFTTNFHIDHLLALKQLANPCLKVDKINTETVDLYIEYLTGMGILISEEIPRATYRRYVYVNNKENEIRLWKELLHAQYLEKRFGVTATTLTEYATATKEFLKSPMDEDVGNRFHLAAARLFQAEKKYLPQTEDDVVRVLSAPFIIEDFGTFCHGQLSPPESRNRSDFIIGWEKEDISLVGEVKFGTGKDKTPDDALKQIKNKKCKDTLQKETFRSCNKKYVLVGYQLIIDQEKVELRIKYMVGEKESDVNLLSVISLPHSNK